MQQSEFNWRTTDGLKIYATIWKPEQEVTGVICLVHGMGEHCSRYKHVAEFFTSKGYAIIANDHRGHGRSEGKRGHTPSFDRLLNEVGRLIEEADIRFPDQPIFVYGHSMGGNLVLNHLFRKKPNVKGVIVSGPWIRLAFEPNKVLIMLGKLSRKLAPSFSQSSNLNASHISRDAKEVEKYKNDPLNHDKISSEMGMCLLDSGEWLLRENKSTSTPLLVMHGSADQITSHDASKEFCKNLSGDVSFKSWEGFYHEIHNEEEKLDVFNYTLDWMKTKV